MRKDIPSLLFPPVHSAPSLLSVLLKALFLALVTFGGPAGVLTALFPRQLFGLSAGLVCRGGEEMVFDQWNDGESTQFRVYCEVEERHSVRPVTLAAMFWVLAFFFIASFYIALAVLLTKWFIDRRRYGSG